MEKSFSHRICEMLGTAVNILYILVADKKKTVQR